MGSKIEIVLWTLIAASIVLALAGHGTWAGKGGLVAAGVFLGLWVGWLVVTSPYRRAATPALPSASELVPRLRSARASGPPLSGPDLAALEQLARNGELDDSTQQESLDAVRRPGNSRAADLAIATALLRSSASALGAVLAALPGLAADEASRVAAAIARNDGLLTRAAPTLLASEALLGDFARALADALSADSRLVTAPARDLARALQTALERDPGRRAVLEARMGYR